MVTGLCPVVLAVMAVGAVQLELLEVIGMMWMGVLVIGDCLNPVGDSGMANREIGV